MNPIKKMFLMNYYRLLLRRNHIIYWLEDRAEIAHGILDIMDKMYWSFFWGLRGRL